MPSLVAPVTRMDLGSKGMSEMQEVWLAQRRREAERHRNGDMLESFADVRLPLLALPCHEPSSDAGWLKGRNAPSVLCF